MPAVASTGPTAPTRPARRATCRWRPGSTTARSDRQCGSAQTPCAAPLLTVSTLRRPPGRSWQTRGENAPVRADCHVGRRTVRVEPLLVVESAMGGGSRPGARPPAGGLQTAAGEGPGWSDRGRVPTRARRPAARRPSEAARRPGWTGTALPRRERRRPPRTGPSPDGSGLDPRRPGCIGVPGAPAAGGVAVASLSPAVLTGSRVGRHTPRRPPRRPAPAAPQLPVPGQPGNVPAHLGSATSRSQPVDAHDTQEPHAGQVGRPLLVACQSNSTRLSCLPK